MKITLITTFSAQSTENKQIQEEARKLGHKLDILDLSRFSFFIKDHKLIVTGLTDARCDIVIIRGILTSIKPIVAVLWQLRQRGVKIFDNNLLSHQYSIDKVADLVKLSMAGFPVPNTAYARDFSEYPRMAKDIGFPLVVKSSRSGKGAHVFKLDTEKQLDELVKSLVSQGKEAKSYLLQEFIPYEHDLRILIIGERVFSMKRIPKEGEFRANFSLGGSVLSFKLGKAEEEIAIKALKTIDMSVGGVDMLIGPGGRKYILEVNHTPGFTGMEKAAGGNIAKIFIEHAIANAK